MSHVTIRMYNVGFGDCFLMTVSTTDGDKRILFDCGSMAKGNKSIEDVAKQVIDDLKPDKRIDVVVCSHRHRDHIAGFAKPGWENVDVGEVWMPWTEDPDDPDATRIRDAQTRLAAALTRDATTRLAALAPAAAERAELQAFADLAANSEVLGEAMDTLHRGFKAGHSIKRRFLPETDKVSKTLITSFTTDILPGVVIHVLGPSKSEEVIRNIDPPAGKSYLQLAAAFDDPEVGESGPQPFNPDWEVPAPAEGSENSISAADRAKIKGFSHGFTSSIAAALDDAVNGTSLMLILEIKGKYFLFSGDAQWGTWDAALQNAKSKDLLKRICFYKIGHHGSHNATPIEFVEKTIVADKKVVAMASTRKFGSWPVPKQRLLDEMIARNVQLARSDKPGEAPAIFVGDDEVIETTINI
jgi:beta-lactamase superfamily II metal-dependent hydrolase